MAANSQSGSFTTLQDWEDRHLQANGNPKAQFWDMSHIGVRSTPINEPAMIERMWDWMGPNEHAWFSRFMPDVRGRYPLETERVNPWNVQMAVEHYGLTPTFNSAVIDSTALKKHPVPIQEVLPAWLELRKQHGMPTNCWQLTAEMLAAYH